ncbi:MAG TPA: hypothetical protein VMF30_17910 [Pirellulales bacterium]|nr:hypothetical protein [Pirellulales bacterium]
MNSILVATAFAHFLAGLALFTLAGMTGLAVLRAAGRAAAAWSLLALAALGAAEWCDLAVGEVARPLVWQWARLALEMTALAGLVELGRLRTSGFRAGLLPRWSYAILLPGALVAAYLARWNTLEFALRLALCWQAGWLAASYLLRGKETTRFGENSVAVGSLAARAILGGLLVYLVTACASAPLPSLVAMGRIGPATVAGQATMSSALYYLLAACVALPLPGMVAALVAVAIAYFAFGPKGEQNRRALLGWRCAWPAGFGVVAVVGCLALAAAGVTDEDLWAADQTAVAADVAGGDAHDRSAGDDQEQVEIEQSMKKKIDTDTPVMRQAKRIGLGLSPIFLLILLIWGLSRLPFVH